jgi:hypothetical protein
MYQERLCQTGKDDTRCPNIIWTDKNIFNTMKCIVYLVYLTNNTDAFKLMYRINKRMVKYALLRAI